MKYVWAGALALGLAGCSTVALDQMNSGLAQAIGQPVSQVESALGTAAEVTRDGAQTKYRWFAESVIEPCQVEVWADADGQVRRTAWSGYAKACEEFASGLSTVFPAQ